MAKVYTFSNWKGGTGKTTLAVNFARTLAGRGRRVLMADLDANCALTEIFDLPIRDKTTMEFLTNPVEGFDGIYPVQENIDLMPGNIKNILLNNLMDTQLKINLRRSGLLEKYDYISLDPPGHWGAHTRNAVFAADVLVIPATCSRIDFEATKLYFTTLRQCYIEADAYIAVNEFNVRLNLPGIYEEYQAEFGGYLVPEPVPYIQSMKRLTDNPDYSLHPTVKRRLDRFVDHIIGDAG
jgi:cellulose biosynthesis protein BcsQ